MSSLTTMSSTSMEESLDTSLSLGIARPTQVRLDELFPPPSKQLPHTPEEQAASSKNKAESRNTAAAAANNTQKHNKRARTAHGDGDTRGAGKKLRLTGEQAALLEETFRAHNILSHAQKHDLARQLRLNQRQVEVWFQNRRARTKQKQTEVDCELLRRWCQRLTDENARLRHQLAQARSSASAVTNVFCPSCDKLAAPSTAARCDSL